MRIAVCIKQVPTREWQPRIDDSRRGVREQDALRDERARRLRARGGASSPRKARRRGRGLHRRAGTREPGAARSAGARRRPGHSRRARPPLFDNAPIPSSLRAPSPMPYARRQFDLVLTGLQSDDQGAAQTGVILAERLGRASRDHRDGRAAGRDRSRPLVRVKRELEGGWFQWVEMPLPALLTIQSGINQLRYATLKGIMAAKKKEIRKVTPASLPAAHSSVVEPRCSPQDETDAAHSHGCRRPKPPRRWFRKLKGRSEGDRMILVVAEQQRGKLHRASWEAVAFAQELAGDQPVEAIVLGAGPGDPAAELSQAAARSGPCRRLRLARTVHGGRLYGGAASRDRTASAHARRCSRIPTARATSPRSWRRASIARW